MRQVRIDDVGASSKLYNQHAHSRLFTKQKLNLPNPLANFWFFKTRYFFGRWGPYQELTVTEWRYWFDVFKRNSVVPIIAVTACWVDEQNNLVPFHKKFPDQAALLKEAAITNKIVIANHGLTHCVVGKHLPLFWGSNQSFHREFYATLDQEHHNNHVWQSQTLLEEFFTIPIEVFVPPGNLWSWKTYLALKSTNIKQVKCNRYMIDSLNPMNGIEFVNDKDSFVIHDRDLKLKDASWFERHFHEIA